MMLFLWKVRQTLQLYVAFVREKASILRARAEAGPGTPGGSLSGKGVGREALIFRGTTKARAILARRRSMQERRRCTADFQREAVRLPEAGYLSDPVQVGSRR